MKVRVGLVGLGDHWENRHRPALRALADRFEVRAVTTPVAQLGDQVARDFQCVVVDGYQALATRSDIDAVLTLAPDWYGPLPILAACDAGKAVYCATALDLRPEDALEIKRRVDESGIAFMAELVRRQAPATLRLKELIATRLGPPQILFCHERAAAPGRGAGSGRGRVRTVGVRTLLEQIDWCRYVLDREPGGVYCVRHRTAAESIDYQMLSLDFSAESPGTGPLAHISYGDYLGCWPEASSFRPPAAMQICCERGVAFIDLPSTLVWFDSAGRHHESLEYDRPAGEQLLTQFYRSVTSLVRRNSGIDDTYRALRIFAAAEQGREQGRRVGLGE